MLVTGSLLIGCGALVGGDPSEIPDYNADIQEVVPDSITTEHFVKEEGTTYYTSPGMSLWLSVNGEFFKMDYFSVEDGNRVYDNLYLYKYDYFAMATSDNYGWYAGLGDSEDFEYAEEDKAEGEEVWVEIKKDGIYKLVFDVDTLKFDLEYKSEIETPVYYTIKNCSIYSVATSWVEMSVNPSNADEFYVSYFAIGEGKGISFFNFIHTSNYNVTLSDDCNETYASAVRTNVVVNVGGNYNVYINRKTYVVRLELLNPETASYGCIYYDGTDFVEMEPQDVSVPYVFRRRITVDSKYQSLPEFHSKKYNTYKLRVVDSDLLMIGEKYTYIKQVGTYDLIVNLKTFEISVELLTE